MKLTFAGALFLVLLVLKLTEVVAWSWWWITAPLWGGLVVILLTMLLVFLIAIVAFIWE